MTLATVPTWIYSQSVTSSIGVFLASPLVGESLLKEYSKVMSRIFCNWLLKFSRVKFRAVFLTLSATRICQVRTIRRGMYKKFTIFEIFEHIIVTFHNVVSQNTLWHQARVTFSHRYQTFECNCYSYSIVIVLAVDVLTFYLQSLKYFFYLSGTVCRWIRLLEVMETDWSRWI